jgi:two-component system, chemotaxis family, response regulator PixG
MVQSTDKPVALSFKDLIIQLKNIKANSFSGNLVVKIEPSLSWTFSFRLGRVGWISGGVDLFDCWQRHLANARLELPVNKLAEVNSPTIKALDSNTLADLLVENLIDRQKCADIVTGMTVECLFDIIQFSQHGGNRLSYRFVETGAGNAELNLVLPVLEIEPILTRAIQTWQEWSKLELGIYAPSLFPVVTKSSEEIAKVLDGSDLYHTILAIDGNRSIRRLAANNRQSLPEFTTTLVPLLRSGFINLLPQPKSKHLNAGGVAGDRSGQPTSSFSLDNRSGQPTSSFSLDNRSGQLGSASLENRSGQPTTGSIGSAPPKQTPLIACIDDSLLIYQSLERILDANGYRHYGVQDPLKIMPSLIRNKPDFIFLDLLMPITNGYEVCEQIRKTPSLKHIPVIILTGKDGLIDRMRSKMVGATGFLGKPVEAEAVLQMIDKHLVVGVNK